MIADNYLQIRTELESALAGLLKLSSDMGREPATLDTLHGLMTDIREPLLFVVVGEVKPQPVLLTHLVTNLQRLMSTARSESTFTYGGRKKLQVSLNSTSANCRFLLRDFNVVARQATNTMVARPRLSPRVLSLAQIFLSSIGRDPWSQSAWDLLDFVQRVPRHVFVIQQPIA